VSSVGLAGFKGLLWRGGGGGGFIMPRPPSGDDHMLGEPLMPVAAVDTVGGEEGPGDVAPQLPALPTATATPPVRPRQRQLPAAEEREEALEVEAALRAVAMAEAREAAQQAAEAAGRERAALRAEQHGGRLGPMARLQQRFDNGGWGRCSARQVRQRVVSLRRRAHGFLKSTFDPRRATDTRFWLRRPSSCWHGRAASTSVPSPPAA
jgi:hypothetical protein